MYSYQAPGHASRSAVEVNVACPNVPGKPLVGHLALTGSSMASQTYRNEEGTLGPWVAKPLALHPDGSEARTAKPVCTCKQWCRPLQASYL